MILLGAHVIAPMLGRTSAPGQRVPRSVLLTGVLNDHGNWADPASWAKQGRIVDQAGAGGSIQSGLPDKINKLLGFVNGGREWLLHQHVLPGLQGSSSDRIVEPIWGSNQHGLDGIICEDLRLSWALPPLRLVGDGRAPGRYVERWSRDVRQYRRARVAGGGASWSRSRRHVWRERRQLMRRSGQGSMSSSPE